MIWIVPGISSKRLEVPVTNLDLVPTLLDLVGAASPETAFEGASLRRWMTGRRQPSDARVQTSWWGDQRMVSDGIFKLLSPDPGQRPALYRLDLDPGETIDRARQERAAAARLRSALEAWRRREPDRGGVSAEQLEAELRSLGYLQ
jgi:arylsulfatase A-like enzyme